MFDFGSPEDTASLFWGEALSRRGPSLPECPFDEMSLQDLRNAFAYLYMAIVTAKAQGVSEAVMDVLVAQYDEVFVHLAECSPEFREALLKNLHNYPTGWTPENVIKYRKLAGIYSES